MDRTCNAHTIKTHRERGKKTAQIIWIHRDLYIGHKKRNAITLYHQLKYVKYQMLSLNCSKCVQITMEISELVEFSTQVSGNFPLEQINKKKTKRNSNKRKQQKK